MMAGAPGRSRETRALHLLGAAVLFVAGAFLIDPSWVDVGFRVALRFEPLGYVLVYAAAVIAFAAAFGQVDTGVAAVDVTISAFAGSIALLGLSTLFGALAVEAFFFREPPVVWAGLLAAPALQCFAAAALSDEGKRLSRVATRTSAPLLLHYLAMAATFAVFAAVLFVLLGAGYMTHTVLQGALLDGRHLRIERLSAAMPGLFERLGGVFLLGVVFFAVVMTAVVVVFDLGKRAFGRSAASEADTPDLNEREKAFAAASAAELRAYAKARGFPESAEVSPWWGLSVFLAILIPGYVGANLHAWIPRPYGEDELAALGWSLFVTHAGPSALLAFAAAIIALSLPHAVLVSLSRTYAEGAGWVTLLREQAEDVVARAIARRRLSTAQPIDPGAFLRALNLGPSTATYAFASVVALTGPFIWHHDQSRYFLLTDEYVEVMEYWTLKRHRYSYDQVQRVDLYCSGRDVEYELVLPHEFEVDVVDGSTLRRRFDAVSRVERKVGDGVARNLPPTSARNYAGCIENVVRDWDEDDAAAAKEIFRLEDWQRQRWIERTKGSEQR